MTDNRKGALEYLRRARERRDRKKEEVLDYAISILCLLCLLISFYLAGEFLWRVF